MPPIRATKVLPAKSWDMLWTDTVALDFDMRHRRRVAMKGLRGFEFLLDLAEATPLRNGDGLVLEDGRMVMVTAAKEPLAEIRTSRPHELMRIAWHLGNRHLPAELRPDAIVIRRDHVIEEMATRLGATVTHVDAPFDPEGGAYASGGGGHHHHEHHAHNEGALEHDDRLEE